MKSIILLAFILTVSSLTAMTQYKFKRGDVVKINGGQGYVFLAVTKTDFEEYINCLLNHDQEGAEQMAANGKLFMVEDGTRARVIDYGSGAYRLRILEGDEYRNSGWTNVEYVQQP